MLFSGYVYLFSFLHSFLLFMSHEDGAVGFVLLESLWGILEKTHWLELDEIFQNVHTAGFVRMFVQRVYGSSRIHQKK